MKLYFSPGSVALASHIALAEAGARFEAIRIDFGSNEQRSGDYLAVNPKGRVPALVTPEGILTETPAVLRYVAESYPDANLLPVGALDKARADSFMAYLASTVHVAHAHGGRGHRWADEQASFDDMKAKVAQTMHECFALIEDELIEGPWVMGEQYTVCDPYLLTISRWLESDGVERSEFPKVDRQAALMRARDPVRRAWKDHFGEAM